MRQDESRSCVFSRQKGGEADGSADDAPDIRKRRSGPLREPAARAGFHPPRPLSNPRPFAAPRTVSHPSAAQAVEEASAARRWARRTSAVRVPFPAKRAAGTEVPFSREKPLKEGPTRRHGRRNRPESGDPLKERPTSGNLLEKSAPLSGTLFPSSSLPSCDAFPRRALSLPPHTFLRHPLRIFPCVFPFLVSAPPVSVMKSSQRACRR